MIAPAVLQHVFEWFLWNSIGAAVLVVLVIGALRLFGSRMSARWRHNLWMLVVLRLLIPMLPAVHLPATLWASIERVNRSASHAPGNRPNPNFTLIRPHSLESRDFTGRTVSQLLDTKKSAPQSSRENAAETSASPRLRLAWAAAPLAEPGLRQASVISPDSIRCFVPTGAIDLARIPSKSEPKIQSIWRAAT